MRSFKNISKWPIQGLGLGIPILCCGWPAVFFHKVLVLFYVVLKVHYIFLYINFRCVLGAY